MGIIGKTQGVNMAANPAKKAISRKCNSDSLSADWFVSMLVTLAVICALSLELFGVVSADTVFAETDAVVSVSVAVVLPTVAEAGMCTSMVFRTGGRQVSSVQAMYSTSTGIRNSLLFFSVIFCEKNGFSRQ